MPIGIFRMLQIPQRTAASDLGDGCEVVRRWWRSSGPFERPCVPRIAPGDQTPPIRPQQVANEHQHPSRLKEHTYGYNQVPYVPAPARLIGINSPRHPQNSRNMHEIEGEVESEEEEPQVEFA